MCTAKVYTLELWNSNIKQLEENMLKSDTSFCIKWKDFSKNKNYFNIEISDGHTCMRKHTTIRKFTMKKTTNNFLMKSQM